MKNERLMNLGARINKAMYKVEELQAQLNQRLKELEEEETTMNYEPMYSYNEETGQSTFNAHTCIYHLEEQCTLHNKPCKNKLACQDYWSKYSDPIEAMYKFTEEQDGKLLHVSCPHNSKYCYDLFSCSFCEYQDKLIIKTEDIADDPIDKDPWYTPSGDEDIADDPWTKAEDTGTVKYTAEGLYDYGYNPIDEDLPF